MTEPAAIPRFDAIVVGAGSAGCVLAARLTEDGARRVLLLEAGPVDDDTRVRIPAAFAQLFESRFDWAYRTVPEPALGGRRVFWPRGRCLGGSSSINAQIWTRGHPSDFDGWARLGNDGWSYGAVQPFFRRAERFEAPPSLDFGRRGPQHLTRLRTPNPLTRAFVQAVRQTGLNLAGPAGPEESQGARDCTVTQRNGRRWSVADAYLRPAMKRPNLEVRTGAHVRRILFDGGRAAGIEYVADGRVARERVRDDAGHTGQIFLCAGAIGSPHLLMLSGVGPGDSLRDHGIPVVRHRPGVGRNLTDHLACGVIFEVAKPVTLFSAGSLPNLLRYAFTGRGPLTSNVAEACAFVCTRPELEAPDLELLFAPVMFVDEGLAEPPGHGLTVAVIALTPLSRGAVRLSSPDPLEPPVIEPNYLSDPGGEDLRVLVQGVRLARTVVAARPFDGLRGREYLPGGEALDDDAIVAHIRARSQTLYHPAGTCRMGSDEWAVVDAALQVHGVEGLFVADASIMPTLVRGHPNAATIMIAERLAERVSSKRSGDG